MRLKNEEYALLKRVYGGLMGGGEDGLAAQLQLLSKTSKYYPATGEDAVNG